MTGRIVFGFVLILLGFLLLLDQAGLADFGDILSRWWPLALVGIGVAQWLRSPGRRTGPVIVTVVGLALLLDTLDIISVWSLIWPLAIIAVGFWLIFRKRVPPASNDADTVNFTAAFGGIENVCRSQSFMGGTIGAYFGGVSLDLSEARLAPGGAHLEVTTLCGGAEIFVPRGWRVAIDGSPIFGGFENATAGSGALAEDAPQLTVSGTILFGGVEINNKGT